MKLTTRSIIGIIGLAFCLSFLASYAMAGGDDGKLNVRPHSQDVDVNVAGDQLSNVTGDTSLSVGDMTSNTAITNKSRAYAFAHGMGDVDINQCMGSEQWSTVLISKQKLIPNLWCMGESYDAMGLHYMAAQMRCDIQIVAEKFPTREDCVAANTMLAPQQPESSQAILPEEFEDDIRMLQAQQIQMYDELIDRIERTEAKPAPRPVQKTTVEQIPFLNDKKRAALMEVVKEAEE